MATVNPGFKRDPKAEAAAIAKGTVTKEQLEERGGLNAANYYGDSWDPKTSLTDDEYKAIVATGATGSALGAAINQALAKKTGNAAVAGNGATGAISEARQSAYDILYDEFNKYGLGSLVESVKNIITDASVAPAQMSLALQNTKEYQQRFSANQDRIKAGLRALSPAEYINKEDAYQNVMRQYGLPASYYAKDATGKQSGFDQLLSNDISDVELEDRIATAQKRVLNTNPEVLRALKQFYPDINNGDILAYTLDPKNAIENIKRKVTAAEIGGAALAQGLDAQTASAELLAGMGITKAQAQQGYTDIAQILPVGSKLSGIYGEQPYTQGTAEAEIFNTAGAAEAATKRKKLSELEKSSFSGSSGVGALGRDKAAYGAAYGQQGQY